MLGCDREEVTKVVTKAIDERNHMLIGARKAEHEFNLREREAVLDAAYKKELHEAKMRQEAEKERALTRKREADSIDSIIKILGKFV